MSFATLLSGYLSLNALVVVAFVLLKLLRLSSLSARAEHRWHTTMLAAVLLLSALSMAFRPEPVFEPVMKVWAAPSAEAFSRRHGGPDPKATLSLASPRGEAMIGLDPIVAGTAGLFVLVAASVLLRLALDGRKLRRLRDDSYLIRKIGAVRLFLSDELDVPFSFWTPGAASVYLPSRLLAEPAHFRIAVLHELQHHRQGDTRSVYAVWGLRALCVLNPIAPLWMRWLSEIQEFACDETLVDQKRVESRSYARCLIEVAETALERRRRPVCATGMVFASEGQLLKRRIETMLSSAQVKKKSSIGKFTMALSVLCLAATAWASRGLVQDRRISMDQAVKLAARAEADAGFPVVMNDAVLKELNRYAGTPEGREYMARALERMASYRPMLEAKLQEYRAPLGLLAIPIVESGYQNLEPHVGKPWGVGLWMFIVSTARNYGLRIDPRDNGVRADATNDQRLEPTLETDAAMRYLKSNYLRFGDWSLAILAYNAGERSVQDRMDATGSRDPWRLVRSGLKTDPGYLAKVMAAIVIFRNPDLVR